MFKRRGQKKVLVAAESYLDHLKLWIVNASMGQKPVYHPS